MATAAVIDNAAEKFESVNGDIINVLKADRRSCLVVANRFFARYIIEEPLKKQIYDSRGESAVKLLLDGLHAAIERYPKYLNDVVEVLSEEHPSLCVTFKKITETAESTSVVTNQGQGRLDSIDDPNKVISLLEDEIQSNSDTFLPANNLSNKFDRLYSHASSSLQHVKLEDLKALLELKLTHSPKPFKDNFRALLKDVTSAPQFFNFLLEHKFCGFLNFDLLSICTKRFGSESLKQEMSQYETSYQLFSKEIKMKDLLDSILNNPSLSKPFAPIGLPIIEYKLEDSWYSRSYNCLFEVITSVYSWCGHGNMMFSDIEEQCIIVNYVLFGEKDLEVVSEDIASPEKIQLLNECGITIALHTGTGTENKCDEKRSKSPLDVEDHESVTCPLCKELFKDPKVLSCHHSFCLDCLLQVKKTEEGSISCPVCHNEEKLPQKGVQGLPAAHHLTSIMELAEILNTNKVNKECSTRDCGEIPVAWCATECGYLCKECKVNHSKMRVTISHVVRSIDELRKERDIPLFCKRHKEQYRQYHCMDCSEMVCPKCLQYCSDCKKLICDGCLKKHGYSKDLEDMLSSKIKKSDAHTVYLLKNLIEQGKAREVELERKEDELKLLSDKINSRQDECRKWREELGKAGETANHFISGDKIASSPKRVFQALMEYGISSATGDSINSEDTSSSEGKMWLYWPLNESQSLEMIEKLQPQHIKVTFPVNPFRASKENWFHVSLNNLLPARPSDNPLHPIININGVISGSRYPPSIKPVGNMTWFVLFNANENKIKVDVSIDSVRPQGSPFLFHDPSFAITDHLDDIDTGYESGELLNDRSVDIKYGRSKMNKILLFFVFIIIAFMIRTLLYFIS